MKAALSAVEQTTQALQQQVSRDRRHWDFDETSYFASGAYTRELLETAARMQVAIFEQDEQSVLLPVSRPRPGFRAEHPDRPHAANGVYGRPSSSTTCAACSSGRLASGRRRFWRRSSVRIASSCSGMARAHCSAARLNAWRKSTNC